MKAKKTIGKILFVFLVSMIASAFFAQQTLIADEQEDWNQLNQQANALFDEENFEEAVAKATQAMEYAVEHFGEENLLTVSSMYTLAFFYGELGYPDDALPIFAQALKLSIKVSGADNPDELMIMIMVGLGEIYGDQGKYAEALPLLEKSYEFRKESLGESDQETLNVMLTLAQVYEAQGQYQKAEKILKKAIQEYETTVGPDDADTLFAKESLASVYKTQDQFDQAESLLKLVLQKKTAALGENDPETIITMSSLAEVYRRMAKYEESETLFLKAVELFKAVAEDDNPDLYQTLGNLALLYQDRGQYPKAEVLYQQVWEYDKNSLGENHPNTIIDLNNLAGIYRLQGKYALAEESFQTALSKIKKVLGDKHPETISIMNNLALLYENQGLFDKADPLYLYALRYSKEVLGETHPTTLALTNNLASLYESQGVFKRSEPLYNTAIQLSEKKYGGNHPRTIASVNNLGYLYLIQQNFDKAAPLFARVLKVWEEQLGERHQKTLKALNNLARVYHKQGRTAQAKKMFIKALKLRKEVLGAEHPDVVRSMVDLASLYLTRGETQEAENMLKEAVALAERILGDKHQYTFDALNSLAELYESSGNLEKALLTRQMGFDRRTEFFNRVLWATGENTRQSYIELHKFEQDRFMTLLTKIKKPLIGKLALHLSLERKGMLLKIASEIHKIVEMTNSPELADKADLLNRKRKQLASMTLAGPTTETPAEFSKKIIQLENELYELQARLGRASMIYHIASRPITVDDVFENLDVGDVLIDYITYNDGKSDQMIAVVAQSDPEHCFVWWECKNNRIEMVPLGDLKSISEAVSIFRETIQDEDAEEEDLQETGADIYALIWQPLEAYIGDKESIYIVPDSSLHLLPFDAVIDENGNYLIENKDLKILSSSRDLSVALLPDAQGEFMILAGPDFDLDDARVRTKKVAIKGKRSAVGRGMRVASHGLRSLSFEPLDGAELEGETIKKVSDAFDALPGAENEGRNISKVAASGQSGSTIFLKAQAEEQRLRVIGSPPKMLHVATHGFFLQSEERLKKRLLSLHRGAAITTPPPGDNPLLRAGLAFAGVNSNAPFLGEIDTDNDGVLTAMEVLGLNLSGTQLVVLSACETGVGEIHAGEGVYGLRRAFQEAGVKSVVNSLWPVSDEGTRRLMTSFYKHIFEGVPARKALKMAQLELLQSEWNSPYYWAAFVLVERRDTASK